jgi:hypothetical protein
LGIIPFGWENILWSFQSQFYFFILLSFSTLYLVVPAGAFSWRWLAGMMIGILTDFSIASGALAVWVPALTSILQWQRAVRRGAGEILGIGLLLAISAGLAASTPPAPQNNSYIAHSVMQFFHAVTTVAAWPLPGNAWLFTQLPCIAASVLILIQRPPQSDRRWCILGGCAWIATQSVVLGYARQLAPVSSRYQDIFVVGQLLNIAAGTYLVCQSVPRRWLHSLTVALFAVWGIVIGRNDYMHFRIDIPFALEQRRVTGGIQADHVREYLEKGDGSEFDDHRGLAIPYPDANTLKSYLDNPTIRAILPQSIGGEARDSAAGWLNKHAAPLAPWVLAAGLLILATGVMWRWRLGFSAALIRRPAYPYAVSQSSNRTDSDAP